MKSKKQIYCMIMVGCLLYLSLSTLGWIKPTSRSNQILLNTRFRPSAQGESISLPVYLVGDYWKYNGSAITSIIYSDHTEVIETRYGRRTNTVIGIEQIRDRLGIERRCYVIKSEIEFLPYESEGSIYNGTQNGIVYHDTQTLNPVKLEFNETVWKNASIDHIFLQNSSYTVNATPSFFPLEPNKIVVMNTTSISNGSNFEYGEWDIYEPNHIFTDSVEYIMTAFSNVATVLGEFSGIKVEYTVGKERRVSSYHTQEVGSVILTIVNDTTSITESSNQSYIETTQLIEYHYTYQTSKSNISGFPYVFIWVTGAVLGILAIIIKKHQNHDYY